MGEVVRLVLGHPVSDIAVKPRLKVSREGVVLIKSLEGFRARAVPHPEGGWVIGYGHRQSARAGAVVGEGDAELLLQYDLLPIVAAIGERVAAPLNQHQIDALASFAFSVGVERFATSDVVEQLNAGGTQAAADALSQWPVSSSAAPVAQRRRTAERALFLADPSNAVALVDLLTAALPPVETPVGSPEPEVAPVLAPPAESEPEQVVGAAEALPASPPSEAPAGEAEPASPAVESVETGDTPENGARAQALAALLGETAPPEAAPAPADNASVNVVPFAVEPAPQEQAPAPVVEAVAEAVAPEASVAVAPEVEPDSEPGEPGDNDQPAEPSAEPSAVSASDTEARLAMLRYSPYGVPIVGPLPGLPSLTPRALPPAVAPEAKPAIVEAPAPPEPITPVFVQPASQPADAGPLLVLTPLQEEDVFPIERPVWPEHQRSGAGEIQSPLFGEEISIPQGYGSVLRHEVLDGPAIEGFEWGESGLFAVMGGVGLVAFGAAMAAFWKASEEGEPFGEMAIIGWVLALIGLICVGISAYNLYRRLGRARDD